MFTLSKPQVFMANGDVTSFQIGTRLGFAIKGFVNRDCHTVEGALFKQQSGESTTSDEEDTNTVRHPGPLVSGQVASTSLKTSCSQWRRGTGET